MKTNELQFSIKNVKYAVKDSVLGTYGNPEDLAFAEQLALEATFNTQQQYGDGQIIATLSSDKGMTGTLTLVQLANQYEIDMKRKMEIDGGLADVTQLDDVEHAIYYEFEVVANGSKKTIKAWLLNVTSGRPSETLTQTKENPTINNIEISLTILGETLKTNLGTADYVDANGNTLKVTKIVSKPGDVGYATFGDEVPIPKALA
jgi:hypothetical protein